MDFYHVNTTTKSMGDKDITTPVEIFVNQSGENISIECKGSDGQQVSEVVAMTLSKLPRNRKESGLTEFIIALCSISILFLIAINAIVSPKQTEPINPVQIGGIK